MEVFASGHGSACMLPQENVMAENACFCVKKIIWEKTFDWLCCPKGGYSPHRVCCIVFGTFFSHKKSRHAKFQQILTNFKICKGICTNTHLLHRCLQYYYIKFFAILHRFLVLKLYQGQEAYGLAWNFSRNAMLRQQYTYPTHTGVWFNL